jgi:hypothetical protein
MMYTMNPIMAIIRINKTISSVGPPLEAASGIASAAINSVIV